MKLKRRKILVIIVLFLSLFVYTSGCLELFYESQGSKATTYRAQPTKISYNVNYGYYVNITGTGDYNIKYECDLPDMVDGGILSIGVFNENYSDVTIAGNAMKSWDISGSVSNSYKLGLTAEVENEVFLVRDLTGSNALTLDEIKKFKPALYSHFCNSQSVDNITYIDPNNLEIKKIADDVKNKTDSNNSFILSKELFRWLKDHTIYQAHRENLDIQPSNYTLEKHAGDCDDLTFLYLSLCRSIGIPSRFIKGFLIEPNEFNQVVCVPHAWAEIYVGNDIGQDGWIPVECACECDDIQAQVYQNFGVESAGHLRVYTDMGTDESLNVSVTAVQVEYSQSIDVDMSGFSNVNQYQVLESKSLSINENSQRFYIEP